MGDNYKSVRSLQSLSTPVTLSLSIFFNLSASISIYIYTLSICAVKQVYSAVSYCITWCAVQKVLNAHINATSNKSHTHK